jgi:hypothetical protein
VVFNEFCCWRQEDANKSLHKQASKSLRKQAPTQASIEASLQANDEAFQQANKCHGCLQQARTVFTSECWCLPKASSGNCNIGDLPKCHRQTRTKSPRAARVIASFQTTCGVVSQPALLSCSWQIQDSFVLVRTYLDKIVIILVGL